MPEPLVVSPYVMTCVSLSLKMPTTNPTAIPSSSSGRANGSIFSRRSNPYAAEVKAATRARTQATMYTLTRIRIPELLEHLTLRLKTDGSRALGAGPYDLSQAAG